VIDLLAGDPLRGHVGESADGTAGAGEFRVGSSISQPEINQVGEVVWRQQDVGGFDVTMHDLPGMSRIQSMGDLRDDRYCPRGVQRPAIFQYGSQIGARDQPHVDVELAVDFSVVMDWNYVWLIESPRSAGLPEQPCTENRMG
jgi:hypothetical protein